MRSVRSVLETPEGQIDFATAKVGIDKLVDPSIDATATLARIESMAAQLRATARLAAPDAQAWTTPWDGNFDLPYPPLSTDKDSVLNQVPGFRRPGTWRQFGGK